MVTLSPVIGFVSLKSSDDHLGVSIAYRVMLSKDLMFTLILSSSAASLGKTILYLQAAPFFKKFENLS